MKDILTDPGEILGLLHQKVNFALQQQKGDEYSQDGCDATLCRLDLSNNELVFSGAQNDLFIYNGNELRVLRAEKQSIGGLSMLGEFEAERIFSSQTIRVSSEDLILLVTDGIPDQLNKSDEAFGIKAFQQIIAEVYTNKSENMSQLIELSITKWKEEVQQQDDLLIFGFNLNSTQNQ